MTPQRRHDGRRGSSSGRRVPSDHPRSGATRRLAARPALWPSGFAAQPWQRDWHGRPDLLVAGQHQPQPAQRDVDELGRWGGRSERAEGFVEDEDERRHAEQPALESSQCQSWTCPGSGRGFLLHALYPIGPVEARSPSGCPGRWGGRWCGFRGAMGKNPLPECTHTVSRHVFRVHEA